MSKLFMYLLMCCGILSFMFSAQDTVTISSEKIKQVTCGDDGLLMPGNLGKQIESDINTLNIKKITLVEHKPDPNATYPTIGYFKVLDKKFIYSIYDPTADKYGAPQKFTKEGRDAVFKIAKEEYENRIKVMNDYADHFVKRGFCKYKKF